jgi:hypothetical protein
MSSTRYLNAKNGIEILHSEGTTQILAGNINPTTSGVDANVGSIYLNTTGLSFIKVGELDTDWEITSQSITEVNTNLDGGSAASVYGGTESIDGGNASTTY